MIKNDQINRKISAVAIAPYETVKNFKMIPTKMLFEYYFPIEVEGYCKSCPNYNRIWSCPPHELSAAEYLAPYPFALVIGSKIKTSEKEASILNCFQLARRALGNQLLELQESHDVEILIAGNCYQCENCNRVNEKHCIHEDRMKYSLESIGFKVGDIVENILNEKLSWGKNGDNPESLMTVSVVLAKEIKVLEVIKAQINVR